ncbi:MAG: hypothetical protein K5777_05215 [Nitrosopumilus sp.]|nr:hypothetical protein [Nitrosopumilus sp.]
MTTKTILMALPIFFAIVMLFTPSSVYAHGGHSHGSNGGGCSDCSPPTLGVDSSGQRKVSGGLSINDSIYDVENFKQDLIPHMFKLNQPIEITLKIYENKGHGELKHVELNLGQYEKMISGVMVENHHATIEWSKTFDGKTNVKTFDNQGLLKDVSVHVLDNNSITGVKFMFTPVKEFDASTIVTKIWDMKRNSNVNYFYNALDISSNEPVSTLIPVESVPEKISEKPKEPTRMETMINEVNQSVQCMTGEVHLQRSSDNSPLCVDVYQASVLVQNNWATYAQ